MEVKQHRVNRTPAQRRDGGVWHKDPAFRLRLTPLHLAVLFNERLFWKVVGTESPRELKLDENLLECSLEGSGVEGAKGSAPETLGVIHSRGRQQITFLKQGKLVT